MKSLFFLPLQKIFQFTVLPLVGYIKKIAGLFLYQYCSFSFGKSMLFTSLMYCCTALVINSAMLR